MGGDGWLDLSLDPKNFIFFNPDFQPPIETSCGEMRRDYTYP